MDPNTVADATTLYYTYSTIAQTLAGAFGFLGAFVLFRLQSINRSCEIVTGNVFTYISNTRLLFFNKTYQTEMREACDYQNWSKFIEKLKAGISEYKDEKQEPLGNAAKKMLNHFVKLLSNHTNETSTLKKDLIRSAKFTGGTIAISLLLLAFVPCLAKYPVLSQVLLGGCVALSLWCVWLYVSLIINVFADKKSEPEKGEGEPEKAGK